MRLFLRFEIIIFFLYPFAQKVYPGLYYLLKSFSKKEPGAVGTMFMHEYISSWNVYMVIGVEGIRIKNGNVAWLYVHGKRTLVYVDVSDNMGDVKQCKYIFM